MITVKNAESYFKNLIGENTYDIKKVWETFKSFCKKDVEGEDDKEILFECGISDFSGKELFFYNFVRQFSIYTNDEYSHMEQLLCKYSFKLTDELSKLEAGEWSMDFDDLDEFFNYVENLQEFKIPLNFKPIKSEIYQEEV